MDAEWLAAWAGLVQVIVVVPAVLLGAETLRRDRKDRRTDRVLALHQELVGDLNETRRDLNDRVRGAGSPITQPITVKEPGKSADRGIAQMLRFFERSDEMRLAGAVDDALLIKLIGSHAVWWDIAIAYDETSRPRRVLHRFAIAANEYAHARRTHRRHPEFADWGRTRRLDFSDEMLTAYQELCSQSAPSARQWAWLRGIDDTSRECNLSDVTADR